MLIDVNASSGRWPFQVFALDSAARLSKHCESKGISLAWVSSIETLLCPDPDIYNRGLLKTLEPFPNLAPVMVINPSLANWRERLEEYTRFRETAAIKVVPGYHGYSPSSKCLDALMETLAERGDVVLMIQMRVEDERNQYPLLTVAGVEAGQIIRFAGRFPEVPILCLCSYLKEAVSLIQGSDNIYVDISFVETLNTVAALLEKVPASRVLFGSHTPFLYTESTVLKLTAAEISKADFDAIAFKNAESLLGIRP